MISQEAMQSSAAMYGTYVGDYEVLMGADAVFSANSNSTAAKGGDGEGNCTVKKVNGEAEVSEGQLDSINVIGRGIVGFCASLGVKQVAYLAGWSQTGPLLYVLGFCASWKAREVYDQNVGTMKE